MSIRLNALRRYNQCIANADKAGMQDSKQFWQDLKSQEIKDVNRLKEMIRARVKDGGF